MLESPELSAQVKLVIGLAQRTIADMTVALDRFEKKNYSDTSACLRDAEYHATRTYEVFMQFRDILDKEKKL